MKDPPLWNCVLCSRLIRRRKILLSPEKKKSAQQAQLLRSGLSSVGLAVEYMQWENQIENVDEPNRDSYYSFHPFFSVNFYQQMLAGIAQWAGLSVLMLGVDFGPCSPISFRQSMYLLQANKSIRPNPLVYSCCHQQSCLLTKDEHFLSSNITEFLSPQ